MAESDRKEELTGQGWRGDAFSSSTDGNKEACCPAVAGSPSVTIREGNVRSKPTRYTGGSLKRIAEQYNWNSNHTIPEIYLGSTLCVFGGLFSFFGHPTRHV